MTRMAMAGADDVFSVDKWTCRTSKLFFLTHLHSDHLKGLSDRWHKGPIYCSAISAALLLLRFPALDRSLLHTLPLETPSLIPIPDSDLLLEVTAIDANHCPGSVMFVFRGSFGCILHTGDFRWESGNPKTGAMKCSITNAVAGCHVDLLCLDNTYCNAGISFPSRHVAAQQVLDIIVNHEDRTVIIGIDMLGKEELLVSIADALQTKICLWPERLQVMRILGISDFFTVDTTITRVRAVPRQSISFEALRMLNEIKPTIAIVPSGFWCLRRSSASKMCLNGVLDADCVLGKNKISSDTGIDSNASLKPYFKENIYFVSYSLHSCFSELEDFITFLKPISVKGNTNHSSMDINPRNLYHSNVQRIGSLEGDDTIHNHNHSQKMECRRIGSRNSIVRHLKMVQHSFNVAHHITSWKTSGSCCRKITHGMGYRKAARFRVKQAWALLRRRRGGGACLQSVT